MTAHDYPMLATCVLHEDRLKKIEIGIHSIDCKLDDLTNLDGPLGLVRDRVTKLEGSVTTLHTRVDTITTTTEANAKAINAILVKVSVAAATLSMVVAMISQLIFK